MKEFFMKKVIPLVNKFSNLKGVVALKDGMTAILSATVVGSVFLLIAEFPYTPIKEALANMGISFYLYQVFNSTFNVLALICVATISYYYAKNDKVDPIGNIVTSIMAFLILSDQFVMDGSKKVEGVLSLANILSSRGMIAAIIVSLVSSYIYCLCIHKKITIKMPDSVPMGVQNSFAALIPSFLILTLSMIIYAIIHVVSNGDLIDCVYHLVQVPLMNLTDSLGGVIVIGFTVSLLWWFGIHGNNVVSGVMTGIWLSAVSTNLDIVKAGKALTLANGGHIVTYQFHNLLVTVTGSGITIGMVLTMLFRAKSEQYKQIGRLSIIPAIFNINEPVIFGVPVVYNPILFIPFVLVPVISSVVSYLAIKSGLVPLFGGVNPPWTTPPIISGLISGGPRTALLQVVIIIISVAIYAPFLISLDRQAYKKEQGEKGEKNEL